MHQPPGFVDPYRPDYVCHPQRSLYGLKQAPLLTLLTCCFMWMILYIQLRLQRSYSRLLLRYMWSSAGLYLSRSTYAEEILEHAHMQKCYPCRTPVDTESKLGVDGDHVCLYMHDLREPHMVALKRILRNVRDTIDHGLQLHVSSTSQLTAYTDADWAGCLITRRSTSAEYRGVANVVAENAWVHNLLHELHAPLFTATLVYRGNFSFVYLSTNPVQHQRTKHIEIDIHFVRDFVASGQVRFLHVPSRFQYADDIFTKGLPSA
ncbi:ribonuclease H-like domain-containing protein, partial [Tanacetum coccineum]